MALESEIKEEEKVLEIEKADETVDCESSTKDSDDEKTEEPEEPAKSAKFRFVWLNFRITLCSLFSIASLLGMGSSNESLTPNLVFNPTTAAATLSQMRLFQVNNFFMSFNY